MDAGRTWPSGTYSTLERTGRRAAQAFLLFAVAAAVVAPTQSARAQAAAPMATASPDAGPANRAQAETRATLARFGEFLNHERYGEVWRPTVTPQGWRPYPPCNWVRTRQFNWYYDDKTPWGAIVHHYGRWANDPTLGWIWVPGAEFSPGWVIWRSSAPWIGWAPTPPDVDLGGVQPAQFNDLSNWTFVDTKTMQSACAAHQPVPAAYPPNLIVDTRYVADVEYIDGLAVAILPDWFVPPLVNVNVFFTPWTATFFAQTIMNWNWVWSNLTLVVNVSNACKK